MFKRKRKDKGKIQRYEVIKGLSKKEMAYMFCILMDQAGIDCEDCPMADRCTWRKNGFDEWLGDDLRK